MSPEFETRRLLTAERATFVAPSQVPQGESLEDEVFQAMFVSTRDFKPATTIIQTAAQRDVYFDVKEAHDKMMNKYEDEVSELSFNNKGDEIGRRFLSDLFFSVAYNSDENISLRPWFLYQKEKYLIRIKSQLRTLGDFLQKTETQAAAGPCL